MSVFSPGACCGGARCQWCSGVGAVPLLCVSGRCPRPPPFCFLRLPLCAVHVCVLPCCCCAVLLQPQLRVARLGARFSSRVGRKAGQYCRRQLTPRGGCHVAKGHVTCNGSIDLSALPWKVCHVTWISRDIVWVDRLVFCTARKKGWNFFFLFFFFFFLFWNSFRNFFFHISCSRYYQLMFPVLDLGFFVGQAKQETQHSQRRWSKQQEPQQRRRERATGGAFPPPRRSRRGRRQA